MCLNAVSGLELFELLPDYYSIPHIRGNGPNVVLTIPKALIYILPARTLRHDLSRTPTSPSPTSQSLPNSFNIFAMAIDSSIEYQLAHAYEDRANEIVVPHVVCLVFAVIAVALRFVSRRMKAGVHLDDWVCLLALV